jgi:acylphosphatase
MGYTTPMFSEIYCVVRGRVQRVGYRDFVERYAKEHTLFGWIRNRDDGSVEMVLQGTPDELKDCIEILNQGSLLAHVESLAIDWRTPEKLCVDFSVIAS